MTITIGTKTIKDANDADVAVKTLNDSTDSTASPLHGVLKGSTGAAVDPATEAKQDTANTALATIATNTTGAATAANQATGNSSLASVVTNTARIPAQGSALSAASLPVVIASDQAALPLPTGAATATLQTTGNSSLSTIATNTTGAATATKQDTGNASLATIATNTTGGATAANQATANTSLSTIATAVQAATPAGANLIGKIGIDQTTPGVTNAVGDIGPQLTPAAATMTRPNDTTTYAAGDLVANSTTAASVVAFVIPAARQNDQTGKLPKCRLQKSTATTANAIFRVHIFDTNPVASAPANGDNGAFSPASITGHRGSFDVTVNRAGGNGAVGYGIPTETPYIDFTPASGTRNLYALIEARAAYAPGAQEVFTLELSTD